MYEVDMRILLFSIKREIKAICKNRKQFQLFTAFFLFWNIGFLNKLFILTCNGFIFKES